MKIDKNTFRYLRFSNFQIFETSIIKPYQQYAVINPNEIKLFLYKKTK